MTEAEGPGGQRGLPVFLCLCKKTPIKQKNPTATTEAYFLAALGAEDGLHPLAAGRALEGSGCSGNVPMHPQPCQHEESRIQPQSPRQQKAQPACGRQRNPAACVRARPLTWPPGSLATPLAAYDRPVRSCLVAISVVSARRVHGAWETWFLQTPCDAPSSRGAGGTFGAPSSACSSTVRSPCAGWLGRKERRREMEERYRCFTIFPPPRDRVEIAPFSKSQLELSVQTDKRKSFLNPKSH